MTPPTRLLYGPGPTMVEPRVYAAMGQPIVGHLDPYFFQVSEDVRALLRPLFGTTNPFTLALSGTGSAGMEAAVSNFVEPGQKMAVLVAGFFAERLVEMGKRYGAEVVRLDRTWGEAFNDDEIVEFIRQERPAVVAYVQAETSTGVWQQGEALCAAATEVGALVLADCVTSLGTMPVRADETGIDVAYSCTQKGLSCPPGLSPITVSPRALERLRARTNASRSWYLDLKLLDEYFEGPRRYHHTAPITLFYALHEGLSLIHEEGPEQRWARHRAAHEQFVAGVEALGLEMFVPAGHRLWPLNTIKVPQGVTDTGVRQWLLREHNIEILGGFGPLAGKIFRIGLFGPLATPTAVDRLLSALEGALVANGWTGARQTVGSR